MAYRISVDHEACMSSGKCVADALLMRYVVPARVRR